MVSVAELSVDADTFPLGSVVQTLPDAHVILERVVPTNAGIVPYFWVQGATRTSIQSAFEEHSAVESITVIDSVSDDEHLVRATWVGSSHGIVWALAEHDITLLSGTGDTTGWTFQIRSDLRDALSAFMETCRNEAIAVQLAGIHPLESGAFDDSTNLTDRQREALELAYERGYFETPRRVSLEELADELDISRQAFSARLRRALQHVVGAEVTRAQLGG